MSTDKQDKAVRDAIAGAEIGAPGLTKREYFAAMAMRGLLAESTNTYEDVAKWAVKQADALLTALRAANPAAFDGDGE